MADIQVLAWRAALVFVAVFVVYFIYYLFRPKD
jgi:hypothetical protein